MKKILLLTGLFAFMLTVGTEKAQAQTAGGPNWISLDLVQGFGIVNIRYEREIDDLLSVGAVGRFQLFHESWSESDWYTSTSRFGALIFVRAYPIDFPLYAEFGVGGDFVSRYNVRAGGGADSRFIIRIIPSVGVKLGGQSSGGFFVNPFINLPVEFMPPFTQSGDSAVGRWTVIQAQPGIGVGWSF